MTYNTGIQWEAVEATYQLRYRLDAVKNQSKYYMSQGRTTFFPPLLIIKNILLCFIPSNLGYPDNPKLLVSFNKYIVNRNY